MRWFETRGPVYPEDNYVVARTDELADFMNRLKRGRYVVLFAPRQTGKTTFLGFKILQVPDTPQEYVGQYLLFAYLEQFVQIVGRTMYLEVQTGRGRMDLLIRHNQRKYIVETKIWGGDARYQAGKAQLAAYIRLEKAEEGYFVVFDHRNTSEPRVETETLDRITIRSYVIPVIQKRHSD